MFLNAMDVLEENKLEPNFNIKVIMDFEEELGSPNLPTAVDSNRKILSADHLIIFENGFENEAVFLYFTPQSLLSNFILECLS